MPDIARRLLPTALLQIRHDLCDQHGAVGRRHHLGAEGHGVGTLRAAEVPELAGGRVAEMTLEIGRDARVEVAVLLGFGRAVQHLCRARDGQRTQCPSRRGRELRWA